MFKSKFGSEFDDANKKLSEGTQDNLYKILMTNDLKIMPGADESDKFNLEAFKSWLEQTEILCKEGGRWRPAQNAIGGYLINAPPDPEGLFIHRAVASTLNREENDEMRHGYEIGIINKYGSGFVDPTGKDKLALKEKWNARADEVDEVGYARFAISLRRLAEHFEREAERYPYE